MADTDVSTVEGGGDQGRSNQLYGTIGEEPSNGTPAFSPESRCAPPSARRS